jgi:hypothetical protein
VYLTQESIGKLYSNYTCEVAECKVSRSHLESGIVKCDFSREEARTSGEINAAKDSQDDRIKELRAGCQGGCGAASTPDGAKRGDGAGEERCPESISRDAEVMVLGRHGYETALKGKNGFVCMVWRSWAAGIDDPEFWNAKLRAPICFNPPAARFNVPLTLKKTELLLAGRSKTQMFEDISSVLDKKELPALESGAMCYMMSKQGYLSDRDGHWHP